MGIQRMSDLIYHHVESRITIHRAADPAIVKALGGVEEYSRLADEWDDRCRLPDGTWGIRNPDMHRRLYLEGLAKEAS